MSSEHNPGKSDRDELEKLRAENALLRDDVSRLRSELEECLKSLTHYVAKDLKGFEIDEDRAFAQVLRAKSGQPHPSLLAFIEELRHQ